MESIRTNWRLTVRAVCLFMASGLIAGELTAQVSGSSSQSSVTVNVLPELLPYKPGIPLSTRTPVLRPTPIRGLVSWAIETRRHRGWLYMIAVSPDGKSIATGGLDGTIRIWNAETGEFLRAIVGHNSYVYGLAWAPDGSAIISGGSFDATARIWNAKTGRLLRTVKHPAYVSRVAWSPDGRIVGVGGGSSGHVMFWDVSNHNVEVAKLEMGQGILSITWSPNSSKIVIAVAGQPAHILDAQKYKVISSVGLAPDTVQGVSWSPDSRLVGAATNNATTIWDTTEEKLVKSLPGGVDVAWSPDGKTVAAIPPGGAVKLLNAETWEELPAPGVRGTTIAWSGNGKVLVSNTNTGFTVWDATTGKAKPTVEVAGSAPHLQWALHGRMLITGVGSNKLSCWETAHAKRQRELKGHAGAISAVALTTNGKTMATASHDKTIKLWDVASGKLLYTLEGHSGPVTCLAWTASGNNLASGSSDKSIKIWDVSKGKLERTLEGHASAVNVLAWAAKSLASGGEDGNVILWNVNSGQEAKKIPVNAPLRSLAWTEDGKMLAIGCTEAYLIIWNNVTGTPAARINRGGSPPAIAALSWSAQGILAAGRGNHILQVWDGRSTDKPLQELQTMAPVLSTAWSRDGKTIIAGANDRCLRTWDAATGLLRSTVIADDKQIALISPEGHYRVESEAESELIYVIQTETGQETMKPADFAAKFKWKNNPATVRLTGE